MLIIYTRHSLFHTGTPLAAESGTDCTTDFIVIPDPSQGGTKLNVDRFCGNALLPTTSKFPAVLTECFDDVGSELQAGYSEYMTVFKLMSM